ncbi:MAG: hypothetical protein J7L43_01445 [Candidatus Aenigmarchaeota archaeon]|nr:hypothetical protein [Candidatus Aenigmarchaeota archaeon]
MVEFESLKAEEIKFGKNNFFEVAKKIAKTPNGESEFISLSKGFFLPDGEKRYKRSIAVPINEDVVNFIAEKIKEML